MVLSLPFSLSVLSYLSSSLFLCVCLLVSCLYIVLPKLHFFHLGRSLIFVGYYFLCLLLLSFRSWDVKDIFSISDFRHQLVNDSL